MIEEGLHYLEVISRTNSVIATALTLITIFIMLFYLMYLFKK